jgi:type I restriction enzyme, S subunit
MRSERVATRLGPLPADWSVRPLGEVTEKTASPIEVDPSGLYREIGIRSHGKGIFHKEPVKGETLGAKRVFQVVPGRLVFNIVFAWEGAVAITSKHEEGMIASHRFPMFGPNEKRLIDVEFLRRFFQTELGVRLLGDASPGGAGRNRTLNQKFAAEIPVPVPPLGEQVKIASILWSMDEAIEATRAVIDQLQIARTAVTDDLLTRGLPGRHTQFKQTTIGELPDGWEVVTLGQITRESAFGPRFPAGQYSGSGNVGTVRTTDITDAWEIDYRTIPRASIDPNVVRPHLLEDGDLLITRSGTCGVVCIFRKQAIDIIPAAFLIRFRLRPGVNEEFVRIAMMGRSAQRRIQGMAAGGVQKNLSGTNLATLHLPLPPPAEQSEIVATAAVLDARLRSEHAALQQLRSVKAALMGALLTGEVRVKAAEESA